MWEFRRGKPHLGRLSLSVTETEELQLAVRTEACRRFQSTRARHSSRAQKAEAVKWGGQDIIWWKDWSWDMPTNCPYDIPWWLKLYVGYRNWTWYLHGITLWKYLYLIYTMYIPEPVYNPCLYYTYTKTQKVIRGGCFPDAGKPQHPPPPPLGGSGDRCWQVHGSWQCMASIVAPHGWILTAPNPLSQLWHRNTGWLNQWIRHHAPERRIWHWRRANGAVKPTVSRRYAPGKPQQAICPWQAKFFFDSS